MIDLMLCVNDEQGDTTQDCRRIDVFIDDDLAMQIEGEMSFDEIPDNLIQIENLVLEYDSRGTMVGNVFWNSYGVKGDDVVLLLNMLRTLHWIVLTEAWQPLWDRWNSLQPFDIDLLNAQVANDADHTNYAVDDNDPGFDPRYEYGPN